MFDQYHYLYVEDDPLSREIMQIVMQEMMGVTELTMFEDSDNFMANLQALSKPPDLILLDIQIKPYSGIDLLKMIRESGTYPNVKVIALTASVMNEEMRRLKSSGFDGAIAKPINVQIFAQLIQRILAGESVWHVA